MSDILDRIFRLVPQAQFESDHELSYPHRWFYKVRKWRDGYGGSEQRIETANLSEADLVCSVVRDQPKRYKKDEELHAPCIDLDLPCRLLPSRTEGHFHLYIDQPITWKNYIKLLEVLAEVGFVEREFVEMTKRDGKSFCRIQPGQYDRTGPIPTE